MRVFSGIQPTGTIHIGNYIGALAQWPKLQNENECFFCVVDLHSLTVPYKPSELKGRILEVVAAYIASGIDPEKSAIFIQSRVSEHSELCWLLNTVTPVGDLSRMTQYKEKARKYKKNINAGLLEYPVLMAADILLYQTDIVPIGDDQRQHLELAREIARRFNKRFGTTFKMPKALFPEKGARIMSLSNPREKMSKSDSASNYISLFEKPEDIRKKIMAAQTDSGSEVLYNPQKKPGISNLLTIYSVFSGKEIKEAEKEFAGKNYRSFKESLCGLLVEKLKPFREMKKKMERESEFFQKIIEKGEKKARLEAEKTMAEVRSKMGLV